MNEHAAPPVVIDRNFLGQGWIESSFNNRRFGFDRVPRRAPCGACPHRLTELPLRDRLALSGLNGTMARMKWARVCLLVLLTTVAGCGGRSSDDDIDAGGPYRDAAGDSLTAKEAGPDALTSNDGARTFDAAPRAIQTGGIGSCIVRAEASSRWIDAETPRIILGSRMLARNQSNISPILRKGSCGRHRG